MEKESLSVQMNPFSGEVCARASLFLSYSDFMASFLAIAKKDIRKNENYTVPFKRIMTTTTGFVCTYSARQFYVFHIKQTPANCLERVV